MTDVAFSDQRNANVGIAVVTNNATSPRSSGRVTDVSLKAPGWNVAISEPGRGSGGWTVSVARATRLQLSATADMATMGCCTAARTVAPTLSGSTATALIRAAVNPLGASPATAVLLFHSRARASE